MFWLLGLLLTNLYAAQGRVEIKARAFQPGEIILVRVSGQKEALAPSGEFLGRDLAFFSLSTHTYAAFAGIDLEDPTGPAHLELHLTNLKGKKSVWKKKIKVTAKAFPRQELAVDDAFVNLSQKDKKRSEAEAEILRGIYLRTTAERFFENAFEVPIASPTFSRFGARRVFNGVPKAPHNGTDIAADTGVPVWAAAGGKVVLARNLFYSGNTVVLDHGWGLYSVYAHFSKILVKEGETVRKKDLIGNVGATGRVTGAHLHWGLKFHDVRVDPESVLALDFHP